MIKHMWSILCNKMITDTTTNTVTLIDIIEEVSGVVKLKKSDLNNQLTMPLNYSLVSMWYKEKPNDLTEMNCEVKVTLITPEKKEVNQDPVSFHFPSANRRLRTQINIQGFPVTVSGDYYFKVEFRENTKDEFKVVSQFPIQVVIDRQLDRANDIQ